jgi:hypothetical protein
MAQEGQVGKFGQTLGIGQMANLGNVPSLNF